MAAIWRRPWRWHLRNLAAIYLLLCLGAWTFERDITFQVARTTPSPEASGLTGIRVESLRTGDGETLVVWSAEARAGQPTILYFHGNGEPLAYRAGRIQYFRSEGYGLYMIAYRGYSGSTGVPSESAVVADAALAYDALRSRGIAAADIVIYGESLGTSVAVQTAVVKPAVAVVLEAPFTSMVATWRQFAPFLPIGLMMRDRFATIDVVGRLRAPLLITYGTRDRLVWPRQASNLFAAASEPKRLVAIAGAVHTNQYAFGAFDIVRQFITDVRSGALK